MPSKRSVVSKSKKSTPKKKTSSSNAAKKIKDNKKTIAAATVGLAALGLAGYAGYKKRDVIKSKAASGSAAAKDKASKLRQSMSDLMAKLMGKKSSAVPPAPAFGFAGKKQAPSAEDMNKFSGGYFQRPDAEELQRIRAGLRKTQTQTKNPQRKFIDLNKSYSEFGTKRVRLTQR